ALLNDEAGVVFGLMRCFHHVRSPAGASFYKNPENWAVFHKPARGNKKKRGPGGTPPPKPIGSKPTAIRYPISANTNIYIFGAPLKGPRGSTGDNPSFQTPFLTGGRLFPSRLNANRCSPPRGQPPPL